jgi:hypothetical protein
VQLLLDMSREADPTYPIDISGRRAETQPIQHMGDRLVVWRGWHGRSAALCTRGSSCDRDEKERKGCA